MLEVEDLKELKRGFRLEDRNGRFPENTHGSEQRREMSSVIEPISSYMVAGISICAKAEGRGRGDQCRKDVCTKEPALGGLVFHGGTAIRDGRDK